MVSITGKGDKVSLWTPDSKIPEQIEQNRYTAATMDLLKQLEHTSKKRDNVGKIPNSNGDNPDRKRLAEIRDSLTEEVNAISMKVKEKEMDILSKSEPNSYSVFKLYKIVKAHYMNVTHGKPGLDITKLNALYERLSDEAKRSELGQDIKNFLSATSFVQIGDKMADVDLFDIENNKRNLSDYSGKYRLLDFWNRGCGPCIAAMPEMKEVAEKYKDKLVVIAINSDSKEVWKKFSIEKGVPGINLNDPQGESGLKTKYGIKAIPNYILIGPDDKIIASWVGYRKGSLLEKVKEFVK